MQRWKLTIEYKGCIFNGWQSQKDLTGVQDYIQKAIYDFSKEKIKIYGAGRTDSGVHALGQVAHFDLKKKTNSNEIREALNNYLRSNPIAIIKVEKESKNFHARFSAKLRHYEYRIINRRQPLTLDKDLFWRIGRPLDVSRMKHATKYLVGTHDFTTFRSVNCQSKSPLKSLDKIKISNKDDRIYFSFEAKSFLHNQVRSIVGSFKLVGEGKWKPQKIKEILDTRNRKECGPIAPAEGLYFKAVDY